MEESYIARPIEKSSVELLRECISILANSGLEGDCVITFTNEGTHHTWHCDSLIYRRAERAALVDAYKRECAEAGVIVTDEMIASAANKNWHDRTQVTWWKRCDYRSSHKADRLIRAVFTKKPHLKLV